MKEIGIYEHLTLVPHFLRHRPVRAVSSGRLVMASYIPPRLHTVVLMIGVELGDTTKVDHVETKLRRGFSQRMLDSADQEIYSWTQEDVRLLLGRELKVNMSINTEMVLEKIVDWSA